MTLEQCPTCGHVPDGALFRTTDFRVAGFLAQRGLAEVEPSYRNTRGETVFVFPQEAFSLESQYATSPEGLRDAIARVFHGRTKR